MALARVIERSDAGGRSGGGGVFIEFTWLVELGGIGCRRVVDYD